MPLGPLGPSLYVLSAQPPRRFAFLLVYLSTMSKADEAEAHCQCDESSDESDERHGSHATDDNEGNQSEQQQQQQVFFPGSNQSIEPFLFKICYECFDLELPCKVGRMKSCHECGFRYCDKHEACANHHLCANK